MKVGSTQVTVTVELSELIDVIVGLLGFTLVIVIAMVAFEAAK